MKLFPRTFFALTALLSASCARYDVSVNDRVVYTPAPLLMVDEQVADSALRHCLENHIKKKNITTITQLQSLSCNTKNIHSLAGLERFTQLTALSLEDNSIEDISPIGQLTKLEHLTLRNNKIESIASLKPLLLLEVVDIRENPVTSCNALGDIEAQLSVYKATIKAEGICGR
jgi:Leucine-rich repeat (LRR) protein